MSPLRPPSETTKKHGMYIYRQLLTGKAFIFIEIDVSQNFLTIKTIVGKLWQCYIHQRRVSQRSD